MALYFNHKTDRRTELQQLAADENITLPLSVDFILWLEDREWVVDLLSGQASRVDGETLTIRMLTDQECAGELQELQDGRDEEEFNRTGC